ncbi:MAG: CGNR zinc finger domain-containing protein, partial [Acidimicrobiales bacterium]
VVSRLNALLERHPIRPRISGHDAESWHLHVSDQAARVADILAAEYLFGLTLVVTELGPDRFGICGASDCNDVFVDLSPNLSRRFCGDKCATRTNVAAYRARRKASTAGR